MTNTDRLTTALADRYRIVEHLGEGGMATVYLAEDLKHDRKVAVKVLRPELAAVLGAERFVQEIKTTASLQHPHILPLFDSGRTGGQADGGSDDFLFYVMPYIDGETLRHKLNRETQLGIDESVRIASEVADALDYAHRHGVIHRDIKPENILLHDGRPMVADFGIALAVSAAAGGRMTETGLSLGTPHYMSPEQATADKDITARSDVYSLGSVLYEMLAGEPPHLGNSAQQIIMKIVTDTARPVTELRGSVPPHVAAGVQKALEKLPADRFESAAAFQAALADTSFTHHGTAAVAAAATSASSGLSFQRWYGLIAGALLLGLWLGGRGEGPAPDVARVTIQLEPGDGIGGARRPSLPALTFSPDGKTIVFAGTRDSTTQLFRRELSGPTTPIAGTEDARNPVFSPDGDTILFWSTGVIRKVPLDGGLPTPLVGEVFVRGMSWGDDGNIVFGEYTGGTSDGIRRITSAGTELERPRTPILGALPHVLPGGRTMLYTVDDGTGLTERHVEAYSFEDQTFHTVIDNASDGRFMPPDRLVFVREGQLMSIQFDPRALETAGGPTVIADDVMFALNGGNFGIVTGAGQYTMSAAGHIAYLTGGPFPALSKPVHWVSRSGTVTSTGLPAGDYVTVRLSPDEQRIALGSFDIMSPGLFVHDLARGAVNRVDDGVVPWFTWSPDGDRIAFDKGQGISVVSADGATSAETLLEGRNSPVAQWTPDGQDILLVEIAGEVRATHAISATTGDARVAASEDDGVTYPTVSPDGKLIAYVVRMAGPGPPGQVVVRDYPALDRRWIVSGAGGGYAPAWTKNGTELVYRTRDSMMTVSIEAEPEFRAGVPRALFSTDGLASAVPIRAWDVTSDGQRFLMLGRPEVRPAPADPEIHVVLNWKSEVASGNN